jgi:hypothetical protein
MELALIGATGKSGLRVQAELLRRGHQVAPVLVAISRNQRFASTALMCVIGAGLGLISGAPAMRMLIAVSVSARYFGRGPTVFAIVTSAIGLLLDYHTYTTGSAVVGIAVFLATVAILSICVNPALVRNRFTAPQSNDGITPESTPLESEERVRAMIDLIPSLVWCATSGISGASIGDDKADVKIARGICKHREEVRLRKVERDDTVLDPGRPGTFSANLPQQVLSPADQSYMNS